jgi:hypothetical protein
MPRYPLPATQPYTGTLVDNSPIVTNAMLPFIGQLGPKAERTIEGWHGRRLAGFGATDMKSKPHYVMPPSPLPIDSSPMDLTDEPDWNDGSLKEMEKDDDVFGSGVFDKHGRITVNPEMGVFSTNPSMPGFIHRNPPYVLNTEVRDVVTGGPTVEVAGGGLFYIERDGRPAPIPTHRTGGGYVFYNPDGSQVAPVPEVPSVTVDPNFKRIAQIPTTPSRPPSSVLVKAVSTVNVANVAEPISPSKFAGLGNEEKPAEEGSGWGKWLAAGLLIGLAGGAAYQVYAKKR